MSAALLTPMASVLCFPARACAIVSVSFGVVADDVQSTTGGSRAFGNFIQLRSSTKGGAYVSGNR